MTIDDTTKKRFGEYLAFLNVPRQNVDDILNNPAGTQILGVPEERCGWFHSVLIRFLQMADARAAARLPLDLDHNLRFEPSAAVRWINALRGSSRFFWPVEWGGTEVRTFLDAIKNEVVPHITEDDAPHRDLQRGGSRSTSCSAGGGRHYLSSLISLSISSMSGALRGAS
jgi:hypothetical protein